MCFIWDLKGRIGSIKTPIIIKTLNEVQGRLTLSRKTGNRQSVTSGSEKDGLQLSAHFIIIFYFLFFIFDFL